MRRALELIEPFCREKYGVSPEACSAVRQALEHRVPPRSPGPELLDSVLGFLDVRSPGDGTAAALLQLWRNSAIGWAAIVMMTVNAYASERDALRADLLKHLERCALPPLTIIKDPTS